MDTRKISLIVGLVSICLVLCGQTISSADNSKIQTGTSQAHGRLDSIFKQRRSEFINNPKHTGLSIEILFKEKKLTYNYGTIDRDKHVVPTELTIYELASVSKSFTGIILAHALLEKRIHLRDDIRNYLPGSCNNLFYKRIPITVADLASHTSGLPKFIPAPEKNMSSDQMMVHFGNFSRTSFLKALRRTKLETVPGKKFAYSNADAQLIGIVLEKIYHVDYAWLLEKYITLPDRMTDTKLEISDHDNSRFAKGYSGQGEQCQDLFGGGTLLQQAI